MSIYLFVLCPPYSGSTLLWKLLATSPNVSSLPEEGQFLDGVREIMRTEPWNPDRALPWSTIKSKWDNTWDQSKPILLEKSPPNLSRAFEIEKTFVPAYFVAMVQNPYAFCEGLIRRKSKLAESIEGAAQFWVRCAQYQRSNIQGLSRVIHFTYESFTENPLVFCKQMMEFIPELRQLDIDALFNIQSVLGSGPKKIVNLSQVKINLLPSKDISAINSILKEFPDLMEYFGYDYIYPTIGHQFRHYGSLISVNATKAARRIRNLHKQVIDGIYKGGADGQNIN